MDKANIIFYSIFYKIYELGNDQYIYINNILEKGTNITYDISTLKIYSNKVIELMSVLDDSLYQQHIKDIKQLTNDELVILNFTFDNINITINLSLIDTKQSGYFRLKNYLYHPNIKSNIEGTFTTKGKIKFTKIEAINEIQEILEENDLADINICIDFDKMNSNLSFKELIKIEKYKDYTWFFMINKVTNFINFFELMNKQYWDMKQNTIIFGTINFNGENINVFSMLKKYVESSTINTDIVKKVIRLNQTHPDRLILRNELLPLEKTILDCMNHMRTISCVDIHNCFKDEFYVYRIDSNSAWLAESPFTKIINFTIGQEVCFPSLLSTSVIDIDLFQTFNYYTPGSILLKIKLKKESDKWCFLGTINSSPEVLISSLSTFKVTNIENKKIVVINKEREFIINKIKVIELELLDVCKQYDDNIYQLEESLDDQKKEQEGGKLICLKNKTSYKFEKYEKKYNKLLKDMYIL